MRRFWRIAQARFALDRHCEGSRLHGGRWNQPGVGALYVATSIELAALEKFVHTGGIAPVDLQLVAVDLPDDEGLIATTPIEALPADWAALPGSDAAQAFGTDWLLKGAELVLLVPSVIVPEAMNGIINPLHPRYAEVGMTLVRPFDFDPRMFR